MVERSLASQRVSIWTFLRQVSIQSEFLGLCYKHMKIEFCNRNTGIVLIKWHKYTRIISTLDHSKPRQDDQSALIYGIYLKIHNIASLFIC